MNLSDPRLANGVKLHQARDAAGAEAAYRSVVKNQPWNVDALTLLGLLYHETGRNAEAVEILKKAVALAPNRDDVRRTLVGPLTALGRLQEAITEAREFARIKPMVPDAWAGISQLLVQAGDNAGAVQTAAQAMKLAPNSAGILVILCRALMAADRPTEALNVADRAVALDPNLADAHIDRAVVLQALGRIRDAIAAYKEGIRLSPQNVPALNNLGSCYMSESRSFEALQCFEAAAKIWPLSAKPRNNIGAAYKEMGNIDAALPHLVEAVRLDPTYGEAYSNIGASYGAIGEHGKAIEAYRDAVRTTPTFAPAYSNLLMSLISLPAVEPGGLFQQHVDWGRRYADVLVKQPPVFFNDFVPEKKLRIGYLSPDFREHSIRYFFEPILDGHDRSRFEVVCYAAGRRHDPVTTAMMPRANGWFPVAGLTDAQLADLIRSHKIDILVELAGHTSDNRLLSLAYKPAPVQVEYLGYPTTTGMRMVDYRITDSICDQPGQDQYHTEKLVRLPDAFFVYFDYPDKPLDPVLPADRNGYFTFGSFNSYTKINPPLLDVWARIMAAVPNSRLLMKAKPLENPSTRAGAIAAFAARGVSADRLDLRTWVELSDHTRLLSTVDLMLDTYPYAGHTTTCQALWMGCPVLAWYGDSFRSRVGLTIMHHLNLPRFAAGSEAEYIDRALQLAADPTELRELRPTLRQRLQASPLCDARRFTANLENAYRTMWRETCNSPVHASPAERPATNP